METASRNPTPLPFSVARSGHTPAGPDVTSLEGEEITGGTLPQGASYQVNAPLPTRWGLLRWQGLEARTGAAVEVLTPAVKGRPLPRALSRLSLLSHRGLSRVLGTLQLGTGQEVGVLDRPAGSPLNPAVPGGARDLGDCVAVLAEVAAALDAIHAADVCHLCLRPELILLPDGDASSSSPTGQAAGAQVLLAGSARTSTELLTQAAVPELAYEGASADSALAACAYLAPEQLLYHREARGAVVVDRRADVYALAVLSYQLLTGALPCGPDGSADTIAAHLATERPRCTRHRADLSDAVETVLRRGLALSPAARHPSCGELVEDLRAAVAMMPLSGQRLEARPSACILVVAGTPEARRELQGLVTAVAPRQPVLTDGGPHGRALALRYCPRLVLVHQASLPIGAAGRLLRQLRGESLLRRSHLVVVVESLSNPAAQELQQLGVTLVPMQVLGSAGSPARRSDADRRPILTTLRRLLSST